MSVYLIHSAKGTSWNKKGHKYISKHRSPSGKMVYVYKQKNNNSSVGSRSDSSDYQQFLENQFNNMAEDMQSTHTYSSYNQMMNELNIDPLMSYSEMLNTMFPTSVPTADKTKLLKTFKELYKANGYDKSDVEKVLRDPEIAEVFGTTGISKTEISNFLGTGHVNISSGREAHVDPSIKPKKVFKRTK